MARLPLYRRVLVDMADRALLTVSSVALAEAAGVNSAKVRKDLSYLGSYGIRGVGYDVDGLIQTISRVLGLTSDRAVCIVGVGHLGRALADYPGFAERGFRLVALFDPDEELLGAEVAGVRVSHPDAIEVSVAAEDVAIAILAVPAQVAQPMTERLVNAGITSILNFTPRVLSVPAGVSVRKVDLSVELEILAFHEHQRLGAVPVRGLDAVAELDDLGHASAG